MSISPSSPGSPSGSFSAPWSPACSRNPSPAPSGPPLSPASSPAGDKRSASSGSPDSASCPVTPGDFSLVPARITRGSGLTKGGGRGETPSASGEGGGIPASLFFLPRIQSRMPIGFPRICRGNRRSVGAAPRRAPASRVKPRFALNWSCGATGPALREKNHGLR